MSLLILPIQGHSVSPSFYQFEKIKKGYDATEDALFIRGGAYIGTIDNISLMKMEFLLPVLFSVNSQ